MKSVDVEHPESDVVSLDEVVIAGSLVDRVGAKAANLVLARRAGLPVLPGVVLTTAAAKTFANERNPDHDRVTEQWLARTKHFAGNLNGRLVVRSSSPLGDSAKESHAGSYTSVLDVVGTEAVGAATIEVIESASGGEMAVLAQPLVEPLVSGVLFGIDPVTGGDNRLLIAVDHGIPERLTSGETTGTHYRLSPRGRVVGVAHPKTTEPVVLERATVRSLARLSRAVVHQFTSPQDVDWAMDRQGSLWLLQLRPVTNRVSSLPSRSFRHRWRR